MINEMKNNTFYTLYDLYDYHMSSNDKWLYFDIDNMKDIKTIFKHSNGIEFIKEYFKAGGKENVIDRVEGIENIKGEFFRRERINHTISAYLLGIIIRDNLDIDMRGLSKVSTDYKSNFLYFWSLTSLFHDIGYIIEENSKTILPKCKNIDGLTKFLGIEYNLVEFEEATDEIKLIRNYYKFRVEYSIDKYRYVDHGIVAALLVYDELMKKLNEARKFGQKQKSGSYIYNEKKFSVDYENNIRLICLAIAKHNMRRALPHETDIYKIYNLHELIPNADKRHLVKYREDIKDNLLFLLGLVDTIEHLKAFDKNEYIILKGVEQKTYQRKLEISYRSKLDGFDNYKSNVMTLSEWMDVTCTNEENISIVINPYSKKKNEEVK